MMGRSESRDGWRAMSVTRKVGNRDFFEVLWSGAGSMGGCGFFPARKMGRLAGVVSGWAEPSRSVGKRDRHVQHSRGGQVAGRNSLLLQMERVSGKRRKKASARKTGRKHGCAATGKLVSRLDSRRFRRAETAGVGHGGGGERKSEETEE